MSLTFSKQMDIGSKAPSFSLPSVFGGGVSDMDMLGKEGLLVVFTCNHCPYAKASWPVLIDLHKEFGDRVGFIGINSNDEKTYPDDSFENMVEYAEELGLEFDYVHDESQNVAKAYGAQCTPDPFLFKNEGGEWRLFYHGRINDNWKMFKKVKNHDLKGALEALLRGKKSPKTQNPSMGCGIKWRG